MHAKVFIDSNILVYAYDRSNQIKREPAKQLIARWLVTGKGVISTQVLQEFYVAATRKLRIVPELAKAAIETLQPFDIVTITPDIILKSIDYHLNWRISFWDALILQAAIYANCDIVYTEDLNHNQTYGPVTVINPFISEESYKR